MTRKRSIESRAKKMSQGSSNRSGTSVDSLWKELGLLADVQAARPPIKFEQFENVWDALESDPARREQLELRSRLMMALCDTVRGWKMSRDRAAKRLKIAPSRLDELMESRFNRFSLGELIDLATEAGLKVRISLDAQRTGSKAN